MKIIEVELKENCPINITQKVNDILFDVNEESICLIQSPNPVCSIFVSDDHLEFSDIALELKRCYPARHTFENQRITPIHIAADIKATILGRSVALIADGNGIHLSKDQYVYAVCFEGNKNLGIEVVVK